MLDIIIINYNCTDHLIKCLGSVEKSLTGIYKASIFVHDNASQDNVDRIASLFPRIRLFKNKSNMGFARAVNNVLKQSNSPYVILLNPDTYVNNGLFRKSLEYMEQHSEIGIMGPKILDNDGKLQNSARSFPTPLTAFFGRSSFLSKIFPKNKMTYKNLLSLKSDGKTPMAVDWVSGACMIVRRKAIEQAGLLDEEFFMYWEDADWCWRMWKRGWKVIYFPEVSIYHDVGASSKKRFFRSMLEFHKSAYHLFSKQIPASLFFLKPLAFGGLGIRLFFILCFHIAKELLKGSQSCAL